MKKTDPWGKLKKAQKMIKGSFMKEGRSVNSIVERKELIKLFKTEDKLRKRLTKSLEQAYTDGANASDLLEEISKPVTVIKFKIPKFIRDYHDELMFELYELQDNSASFFSHDLKISKSVEKEFQSHFSNKHYSEDTAGVFEAWPVMTLLKQSMEIGYRLGTDPEYSKKIKAVNDLYKKLESHNLVIVKGHRDFNLFQTESFTWTNDIAYYSRSDLRYMDNEPITGNFNGDVFTPKKVQKSFDQWLIRMTKLAKNSHTKKKKSI